jgi:hypothetical protein
MDTYIKILLERCAALITLDTREGGIPYIAKMTNLAADEISDLDVFWNTTNAL